jgi:hypothetical protein
LIESVFRSRFREGHKGVLHSGDVKEQRPVQVDCLQREREIASLRGRRRSRGFAEGRSYDEGFIKINWLGASMVFDSQFCLRVQKVEPQGVFVQTGFLQKARAQGGPFFAPDLALENGLLDTNAIVLTRTGNAAEAARPAVIGSGDIVSDQNEHGWDYFGRQGG